MSEPKQDQAFQQLLSQYFPRDAVRIREDVRIVDASPPRDRDFDADPALAKFLSGHS